LGIEKEKTFKEDISVRIDSGYFIGRVKLCFPVPMILLCKKEKAGSEKRFFLSWLPYLS
jgi:hypothetical protein